MKPSLSDCAAPRLVQRAGAIELVIRRLCCDVAQTVRAATTNLRRSATSHFYRSQPRPKCISRTYTGTRLDFS